MKKKYTIDRLIWIQSNTIELYYLGMILTVRKGSISYNDIKKLSTSNIFFYRKICFTMDFLQDEHKFIKEIK